MLRYVLKYADRVCEGFARGLGSMLAIMVMILIVNTATGGRLIELIHLVSEMVLNHG